MRPNSLPELCESVIELDPPGFLSLLSRPSQSAGELYFLNNNQSRIQSGAGASPFCRKRERTHTRHRAHALALQRDTDGWREESRNGEETDGRCAS